MTEEQIKECLSRSFVNIIANNNNFICTKPESDEGVDLYVNRSGEYIINGNRRNLLSGEVLHVQLKSTTSNSIIDESDIIKYDLEAKTYNDLITRRDGYNKLILILYILPQDRNEWVEINDDELILRKYAYWFYPDSSMTFTPNTSSIRINIPKTNKLDINFFQNIFSDFYIN